MAQPHYVRETQILQRVACNQECRWRWTQHALEQMHKRGIFAPDVQEVVMNGQVTLQEHKRDILWRVRGRDIDGGIIEVVVAVYEAVITIKVVTAF